MKLLLLLVPQKIALMFSMKKSNSFTVSPKTSRFIGFFSLLGAPLIAQVSPAGGTFADKAIITEATAGETITRSTTVGGLGPALIHNFDAATVDPSYTITPGACLLYTSPSPRDRQKTRMPSSA